MANLLEQYLAEDPKNLTPEQLLETAKAFGLPLSEVRNIARGMSAARKALKEQEEETGEVEASGEASEEELREAEKEGLVASLAQFHLAGQHDQSSHGSWAEGDSDVSEAPPPPGVTNQQIRDWARKQGLKVGDRGRLHPDIVSAYEKAHATPTEPVKRNLDEVRQWLRDKGYSIGDRGRIAQRYLDEYDKANASTQPETTEPAAASAFATRFGQLAAQMGPPETWFPKALDLAGDPNWSNTDGTPGARAIAIGNRVQLLGSEINAEIQSRLDAKGVRIPTEAQTLKLQSERAALYAEFKDAGTTLDLLRGDIMQKYGAGVADVYSRKTGKNLWNSTEEELDAFYKELDKEFPGYYHAKSVLATHGEKIALKDKEIRDVEGNYSRAYAEAAREVLNEIRPFGHEEFSVRGAQLKAARQAGDAYPDEWVQESNRLGSVEVGTSTRGWHSGGRISRVWIPDPDGPETDRYGNRGRYKEYAHSQIKIAKQPTAMEGKSPYYTNVVHEMGHRFEGIRPWIKNIEWVLWNLRAQAATGDRGAIRALKRILPNYGYKADEKAVSDDYVNAYMGKIYKNSYDANYELFTMGMESLMSGSYPIWKDQSYLNYILGILGAG